MQAALVKKTLVSPVSLRDNGVVIADQDWVNGRQAAWTLG